MQSLEKVFADLPDTVEASSHLKFIGRFCNADFMLEVGEVPWHFRVREGALDAPQRGPFRMRSWQFAIRAPEASWHEFWSDVPPPGYNDIFAMTAYGHAKIDGDVGPLLSDLRFLKEIIALPRGQV